MRNIKISLRAGVAPVVLGLALMATPSLAQVANEPAGAGTGPIEGSVDQSTADGAPDDQAEEVVVTGSRIRSPNLESASPITVLNSQEIKFTGTTRIEDLVNSLPQVFAGQGGNVANGATGTATLNLRGLGSERTLVLVNGRRLVPGDPTTSAADINVIPAALIDRVDVLSGGASAVYGADAVAGVVNFIMDTDFEGFRVDGQYSFFNHSNRNRDDVTAPLNARRFGFPKGQVADGGTIDATAAFGAGFDDGRGHVTAYVGYRKINSVSQDRRDYSACALSARTQAAATAAGNRYTCGGSATSANGTFFLFDSDNAGTTGTSTTFQVGSGRTFIPGSTPYNFAPTNYYQRPDERYTAGLFANYEISPAIKPYLEFMFMNDRTVAQIAPSGNFGNTFNINCDNPLLSPQQFALVCDTENLLTLTPDADGNLAPPPLDQPASVVQTSGLAPFDFIDPLTGATYNRGFLNPLRRNVEGGPRQDDLEHTSYRIVAGVRGDLARGFGYDMYYQYGRTNFAETYFNDFSVSRLRRALDVVAGPGGVPTCRSVLDSTDVNCVPYDIFAPGGVTQAALNYLQVPGFQRGTNGETVFNASINGQLGEYGFQSPFSTEGVGFAAGFEYRKETLDFTSDVTFQTGDLAGQGAATLPVAGSFDVKEGFAELRVPLVTRGFVYDLSITGGYRYSDYSTSSGNTFSTDTYKVQGEFAPIQAIRFRGGYNRAVRVPTVQDLFAPQRVVLNGSTDPCAGRVLTAADVGCLAQGLAVGQTVQANPAAQYNGLIGGNPDLDPEVADTYTAGIVFAPDFIPRLAITVDYFNIKVDQAVQGIGQDTILAVCTSTADPVFCDLIQRDTLGSLWRSNQGFVTDITQNIGGLKTAGIDVDASYSRDLGGLGVLGLSFVGTWLDKLEFDTGVLGSYDCKGLYGNVCGTPNPEWRHQARATLTLPNGIGASLRWRYFGNATLDAVEDNPVLADPSATGPAPGGVARPGVAELEERNYFDLALTFRVGDNYNFRLGANNLLDKAPPLTGSQACPAGFCNGNTFAQVYDALGRYIYAGVTLDF